MFTSDLFRYAIIFAVLAITGLFSQERNGQRSQNYGEPSLTWQNINNFSLAVASNGVTGLSSDSSYGGFFPRKAFNQISTINYGGLVWTCRVNGLGYTVLRGGGQKFISGTVPGWIVTPGDGVNPPIAVDPSDPRARVYRIRPDFQNLTIHDPEVRLDAGDIFRVDTVDVSDQMAQAVLDQYALDWNEWPVDLGAPFYDANGNGSYEPGQWTDLDNDGFQDRGEVEEPGLQLADQVTFLICNDTDSAATRAMYGSPPIGLELQITLWGYKTSGAIGNTIYRRYRFYNKSGVNIEEMYLGNFIDFDLGNHRDDLIGCDTTLSMGFVYNGYPADDQYQARGLPPAAIGSVLLQGPLVPAPGHSGYADFRQIPDTKNLPMTSYYAKNLGSPFGDPRTGGYDGTLQLYNILRGFTPTLDIGPLPWITGAGPDAGLPTKFPMSGDPVSGYGDVDNRGYNFPPGERRMSLNTGPFEIAPGDFQEAVFATVGGLDEMGDAISSFAKMRDNIRQVKSSYGRPMVLPRGRFSLQFPDGFNSEISLRADLREFSGLNSVFVILQDLSGSQGDLQVLLFDDGQHGDSLAGDGIWGNSLTTANRQFPHCANLVLQTSDRRQYFPEFLDNINLRPLPELRDWRVIWENARQDSMINTGEQVHLGFSIYNPDMVHPVNQIEIENLDRPSGYPPVQRIAINDPIPPGGSRNGMQQYLILQVGDNIDSLIFSYRLRSDYAQTVRSAARPVIPWTPTANWMDTLTVISVVGNNRNLLPIVADSSLFLPDRIYQITFSGDSSSIHNIRWHLTDARSGEVLLIDQPAIDPHNHYPHPIVDGIMFVFNLPGLEFSGFTTIANAAGPLDPAEGAAAGFAGFPAADPTDRQQVGAGKWLIHTGDNGSRGSYAAFLDRVSRSGDKWAQIIPNDFEIRFTAGGSAAIDWFQNGDVFNVPFELWNTGIATPDDPSDDYRMIPVVFDWDLDQQFDFIDGFDHTVSDGNNDPQTDWIYFYDPQDTSPGEGGYLSEENILLSDPASWERSYAREVMSRFVFVNWNGGDVGGRVYNQDLPEEGSVFRIESNKPNYAGDTLLVFSPLVAIDDNPAPKDFALYQNFPNPFNPETVIRYSLSVNGPANLEIYDVLGRKVKTLVNKKQQPGNYRVTWNGRAEAGQRVASGLYFYRLTAGDFVKTRKMVLIR